MGRWIVPAPGGEVSIMGLHLRVLFMNEGRSESVRLITLFGQHLLLCSHCTVYCGEEKAELKS